jgi:DnaJ-class molecular chaperone
LLELNTDAESNSIKRAFRKVSLKYHPDKNPGDEEASEKFRKANRCNEILVDDNKRHLYNTGGEDAVERYERGESGQ